MLDLVQKITNAFPDVNKVFLETLNHEKFLRIEVKFKSMDEVVKISREILSFLDSNRLLDENTNIDIYSSGPQQTQILPSQIVQMINKKVEATLKNGQVLRGTLLTCDEKFVEINCNYKGRLKKEKFAIDDLETMASAI